jgi:hypothetical protein
LPPKLKKPKLTKHDDDDERPIYQAETDPSLTKSQAKNKGFKPDAWHTNKDPRVPSLATQHKEESKKPVRTGRHEAAVTTDTLEYLRRASDNKDGTHMLPLTNAKSYFAKHQWDYVYSKPLRWTLKHMDPFRTDTAQTVLSAPKGEAAGHSHSNLNTSLQDPAHNLVRAATIRLLKIDPAVTPGYTERAIIAVFSSITVTSLAPGELARTVAHESGKSGLRDFDVRPVYEAQRNEMKRRVNEYFDEQLNDDEREFVRVHAEEFMASTQPTKKAKWVRTLLDRPASPARVEDQPSPGQIGGGAYAKASKTIRAKKRAPDDLNQFGMFLTEPARAPLHPTLNKKPYKKKAGKLSPAPAPKKTAKKSLAKKALP